MSKCTRCGKERIIESSYTEIQEKTTLIHTITVCPDPQCQEAVDKNLVVEEKRRKVMQDEHEKRTKELILKRNKSKKIQLS